MEDKETVSFRTDPDSKEALDAIAKSLSRDRTFVINEAIRNYIDLYQWQIKHIGAGLEEARRGDFAPDEEVSRVLKRFRE